MTFYVENETDADFPFDILAVGKQVAKEVLEAERCPYEVQVNLLVTDNAGIREFNKEYRGIDAETDVLSFPGLEFARPGVFEIEESSLHDCFDPDSKELILGDIIVSADRVREQAENYGHSEEREFAFLVAHSMFHLCGYDHMEETEARVMERKQEEVLKTLGITRDKKD
ncbi:MAG TPA: rRNA maturation RNase YbeY [Candidatus Acetatifactor stercoripullorum]|uniref:Endoribonuclease YbeY n=1 Tax=Candidatus Acetatifactor stercoripullorum TaxID=2838414 RepID=A0A9D1R5W1_9FIRM|nr:rRNA maturation RNase YbeY [Candidatus Acetatifactor stercoripullorum]HIW81550.1 rRNA maturation RNase YbeY [Candidatus Acetatifactor stercoripullorum]